MIDVIRYIRKSRRVSYVYTSAHIIGEHCCASRTCTFKLGPPPPHPRTRHRRYITHPTPSSRVSRLTQIKVVTTMILSKYMATTINIYFMAWKLHHRTLKNAAAAIATEEITLERWATTFSHASLNEGDKQYRGSLSDKLSPSEVYTVSAMTCFRLSTQQGLRIT